MIEKITNDLCVELNWIVSRAKNNAMPLEGRNRELLILDLENAYDKAHELRRYVLVNGCK
tara:strand:- start:95 stop:274 length:180 start_codon:yes stop_codon:yes gene_type:complete